MPVPSLAQPSDGLNCLQSSRASLPEVRMSDLNFSSNAFFVNRAERYVIKVPTLPNGGEPLMFPDGTPNEGDAIRTNTDGSTAKGVVYFNAGKQIFEGILGDGTEALILSGVHEDLISDFDQRLEILNTQDDQYVDKLHETLRYFQSCGEINLRSWPLAQIVREMGCSTSSPNAWRHRDSELVEVAYVPHGCIFVNGNHEMTYPLPTVFLKKGNFVWGQDPQVFLRDYRKVESNRELKICSIDELSV